MTWNVCIKLQVRLTAAEERATRADWEKRDAITSLERQLAAARAEVHDWRREAAAAEAERDRLAADRKMLTKRSSSGSLYAGYGGGTPKARGEKYNRSAAISLSTHITLQHKYHIPNP